MTLHVTDLGEVEGEEGTFQVINLLEGDKILVEPTGEGEMIEISSSQFTLKESLIGDILSLSNDEEFKAILNKAEERFRDKLGKEKEKKNKKKQKKVEEEEI